MEKMKKGFTLAEVLITLMIIGVVAAIAIPAMMTSINDTAMAKQKDIFSKKFTEGLRQMRVDGKLMDKYASTEDFVKEMQKYFKIANVCNNTNLSGCFQENFSYEASGSVASLTKNESTGTISFSSDRSKKFKLSTIKTAKNIKDTLNYDTNVMGISFADGVQMLLYVNPNCEGPADGDTHGNVTSCISYMADVNQAKSPNIVGNDILSNISFVNLEFEIASVGAINSSVYGSVNGNYWLGAKTYCESLTLDGGGWKLPDTDKMRKLATAIGYFDSNICSWETENYDLIDMEDCNEDVIKANSLWRQLAAGTDYFHIWSSDSYDDTELYEGNFYSDCFYYSSTDSRVASPLALCIR